MRFGFGGLVLAAVLSTTACSKPQAPAAAPPPSLALPVTGEAHGVLPPQTLKIAVKAARGGKGDYAAEVALTPSWWAGQGEFKIVWYAGLSQTKRFFNITGETGDRPSWIKDPETGVRQVQVSFDGGPLQSVKPQTARAPFQIPAGAQAVTEVKVDFGPADSPQTADWK